jgi:hypothetical protein
MAEPLSQHTKKQRTMLNTYTLTSIWTFCCSRWSYVVLKIQKSQFQGSTRWSGCRSNTNVTPDRYAAQQHTSLLRFILHRLPATVSAQLFVRIGSTLCSRTLHWHDCSLQNDNAFWTIIETIFLSKNCHSLYFTDACTIISKAILSYLVETTHSNYVPVNWLLETSVTCWTTAEIW